MASLLGSVLTKTLWDQRWTWLWWGLGLLSVVVVYVAPFQQYREAGILDVDVDIGVYRAFGIEDLASPEGYLQGSVFGLLGPLLVIMAAVTAGARAIAGDEEAGTLDLLLAHPVSRTRLVLERFAALVVALVWLGVVVWVASVVAVRAADMGIAAVNLAAAVVGVALLGLVFGTLALAVGGLRGRRGMVLGVTSGVAVAAYLVNNLAPQVEGLEGARLASPFHYAFGGDPLRAGFDLGHVTVLAAVSLALVAGAVWAFNRRDVAV